MEAATDPFPNTNPAFFSEDDDDIVWKAVTGGELGDMCVRTKILRLPPRSPDMSAPEPANTNGRIVRLERLGGLLDFYHLPADPARTILNELDRDMTMN